MAFKLFLLQRFFVLSSCVGFLSAIRVQPALDLFLLLEDKKGFISGHCQSVLECYRLFSPFYLHCSFTLDPPCTLLHCAALYSTVFYCTALHSTVLYIAGLFSTVLNWILQYCTGLFSTVLHCTLLYCTVPYYTALVCTTLSCILLYLTILH